MEYSINPQDSAILYFVVYLNGVYTIYFIYLVDSTSEEVCSMISYDITKLKISEDLHSIFVVRNIQQGTVSKNYLYSIPFGNSVDFDDDDIEHSAEVGNQVYSLSTIGSGVIIVYNDDQCINIATFINSNFLATIDKFHQLDDTYQYSLMENHKII